MKLYYVANARMPTEKAHGIQIAKMCEAFELNGVAVTLIVPTRGSGSIRAAYGLKTDIGVVRIPVWNVERLGPIGYRLTALQFTIGALLYLGGKCLQGELFTIYTVDMDAFSFAPLTLLPRRVVAEMHSPKQKALFLKGFFSRAHIIATNSPIGDALRSTFELEPSQLLIEPNGVDDASFAPHVTKEAARKKLGLPQDTPIVMYVGRAYAWKGLDILADLAERAVGASVYMVGASQEAFESVTNRSAAKLTCVDAVPVEMIPVWLAAADVLLVLGTQENANSYRYTSPMKVFEYLQTKRPIVFSRTPALESIVPTAIGFWYTPDDPDSLAEAVRGALGAAMHDPRIEWGSTLAAKHTWRTRAARIEAHIRAAGQEGVPAVGARTAYRIGVGALMLVALFFAAYHLFDSPEPWTDEGLIIQSAIGLLQTGVSALPIAPGVFEPAWYITSGFPITAPLAAVFSVWGVSLEAARLVMLVFLFIFFGLVLLYARRALTRTLSLIALAYIVFFGPVYGHGRNVLGEIPGLCMILVSVLPLIARGPLTYQRALIAGLGAGLAFATKPIYILFPAALLIVLLLRRNEVGGIRVFAAGIGAALVPIGIWLLTQFTTVDFKNILSVYANPHELSVGNAIVANALRLVTEIQPAFFLMALAVWLVAYAVRRWRREPVSLAEETLLLFSALVLFAYLRTAGYYRYFFPGQIFAVLYLPQSAWYLARRSGKAWRVAAAALLSSIFLFQAYQTTFRSWTATHYDSPVTSTLRTFFADPQHAGELFVFQAPELIPFAYGRSLYQYELVTPSLIAGASNRVRVTDGTARAVMTKADVYADHATTTLARYTIAEDLGSYVLLVPRGR